MINFRDEERTMTQQEYLTNLEKKYELREFPLNVAIEVCNHCNLNCIMCANDQLKRKRGSMSIKLYKKIIDEIAEVNPNTRIWLDFYGEPLLVKYKLYYMIDYAKKKGLTSINMNSNGTLLDDEMAEMILDSGIDFISFDVDGFSSEVYEKIRVNGNRDVFYNNILNLIQKKKERDLQKPIIEMQAIEMPENKHEIQQILDYWLQQGVRVSVRNLFSWAGQVKSGRENTEHRIACGFAIGHCAVTWEGDVVACGVDCDAGAVFGNLNMNSIKEIWNVNRKEFMEDHLAHRFGKLPTICKNCTDWQGVGDKHFSEDGKEYEKSYDFNKVMVE